MNMQLKVTLKQDSTSIQLEDNQDNITIVTNQGKKINVEKNAVYLLIQNEVVHHIGQSLDSLDLADATFDQVIFIKPSWEVELPYLVQSFIEEAEEKGVSLDKRTETVKIPKSQHKAITEYREKILFVLEKFGYSFNPKVSQESKTAKPRSAKARHRWSKEVSEIEFFVDTRESRATVLWQKRNEMLLKAGAVLKPVAPLNKDGSVGFSAKMGDKLRMEHADKIKDFVTIEDIVLKSVNEIGLFLYFAGTNSWLELKDSSGKTIDSWTIVEG